MKTDRKADRRSQPRFPQHLRVSITELPWVGSRRSKGETVTGHVHNISQGGLCVITTRALPDLSLVRCEIAIGEAPIKISTLTQVRWTQPQKLRPDRFMAGLSFLL